ncbi:DUF1996 domain-containing protein [Actinomadura roseirufa]|uniref:DUF1996 domain-containing protein n=1 Tax=Actinomadura roseirufa TaxID=2094049 RepID=UPI0010415B53|nr:DUF1996 domain-containing protein [Actinomadura roseirufa]
MRRTKKAFAVMVPALVLVASAAEAAQAGAAGPRAGGGSAAVAPTDPPEGGDVPGGASGDLPGGAQDGGRDGAPGGGRDDPGGDGQNRGQDGGRDGGRDGEGQNPNERRTQDQPQRPDQPQQQAVKPGPDRVQFADVRQAPAVPRARPGRGGSRGTFTSNCGRNAGLRHSNPDNVIVAPGVTNGAHHVHDYVGNESTDGFSTDDGLAAAGTTCANGDRSTYYWPVVRLRAGRDGSAAAERSRRDGNVGSIVTPASARLEFRGNARAAVTAMPRFLRAVTGDAKAGTNGTASARARWTCTGFADRAFTDRYPLCPRGGEVTRVLDFPSCWDGQNTDSANHRDHIVFPDPRSGACPQGTRPVPQLRMTLTYDVPARPLAFALDTFPEQGHDPVTDHGDFINVMPDGLMRRAVACINGGRAC